MRSILYLEGHIIHEHFTVEKCLPIVREKKQWSISAICFYMYHRCVGYTIMVHKYKSSKHGRKVGSWEFESNAQGKLDMTVSG